MATLVSDLRAQLRREINVPGFAQLPDITNSELDGYIMDGFWEGRLLGLLGEYTQTDGTEMATPAGPIFKVTSDGGDLEPQYRVMIVMIAALKLLRLKLLSLAVNIRAQAGPVEYEQQASATVLRAILEALERRIAEIKGLYGTLGDGAFYYFDAELQRDFSLYHDFASYQVVG